MISLTVVTGLVCPRRCCNFCVNGVHINDVETNYTVNCLILDCRVPVRMGLMQIIDIRLKNRTNKDP